MPEKTERKRRDIKDRKRIDNRVLRLFGHIQRMDQDGNRHQIETVSDNGKNVLTEILLATMRMLEFEDDWSVESEVKRHRKKEGSGYPCGCESGCMIDGLRSY